MGKGKGKGMRELAVLKWHSEGLGAVGFADVVVDGGGGVVGEGVVEEDGDEEEGVKEEKGKGKEVIEVMEKPKTLTMTLAQQREQKAVRTHWLAVGGKDGKVSLWDIY